MGYRGLQIGIKKARRRTPKRYFCHYPDPNQINDEHYQRSLSRARNTTKRCSAAIHGCGHRRELEGETVQERKADLATREQMISTELEEE